MSLVEGEGVIMNVSDVSYNGNVQQKEWKSIEPLQNTGSQGLLTGLQLSSEKRLDNWEITSKKSDLPTSTATIDNSKPIKVVHIQEDNYLKSSDQYLGIFEQYAKGELNEDDFEAYSYTFGQKIGNTLQTGSKTVSGLNTLVEEMKANISKGIANTPDNLKTELTIDGMKLTWKDLMNLQNTGEYLDKIIKGSSPGTYDSYAGIGVARAYIHKSGLGLTEDQVKMLDKALEKKIDRKLENTKKVLELASSDKQNSMWEGYYTGGTSTMPVASNTELISKITEAFSKIDPDDQNSFEEAINKFQELMRPWNQTFASHIASQAPGYASFYVQEKEANSRKYYQALWNGTY